MSRTYDKELMDAHMRYREILHPKLMDQLRVLGQPALDTSDEFKCYQSIEYFQKSYPTVEVRTKLLPLLAAHEREGMQFRARELAKLDQCESKLIEEFGNGETSYTR